MWVPPEEADPILLHAPTRKNVALFGAVRPADGCLVVQPSYPFNTDTFRSFLKTLLRHHRRGRRMTVILDNAKYHHARALRPWLDQHRDSLCLDYLPAYSPDLNPQERVWKLTRRLVTHNRYFPQLQELLDTVLNHFAAWAKPNQTLRKLCAII
jgi:transposase